MLCEDLKTDVFVRRFLRHRNFKNRDVTTLPFPRGKGSGEAWVRERFPKELRAIRTQKEAYLIVVIDADSRTIEDRHRQMRDACEEVDVAPRREQDPVIIGVPKRNLETWLAYLNGKAVDEETDYKSQGPGSEKTCKPLADRLYEMCHRDQQLREPVPSSLEAACAEYKKLKRKG